MYRHEFHNHFVAQCGATLWFMLDIYQSSHKKHPAAIAFLERTNREYIIDRFRRVVHTLSVNSTQFVESRAKLLNAYNEPGINSPGITRNGYTVTS